MAEFNAKVSIQTEKETIEASKSSVIDISYNNTFRVPYATALNELLSFDAAGTKDLIKSKFLMVSNVGDQTAEVQFVLVPFARSNDTKTDTQFRIVTLLLKSGEYITLPTSRILHYNPNATNQDPWSGTPALESAADANEVTFTDVDADGIVQPVSGGSTVDTQLNDGDNINTTDTALVLDSAHARCYKKYDYIVMESEIMFVTAADHDTNLTVERAALGSSAATHNDDVNISLYCGNTIPNDTSHSAVNTAINSSGTVMTSPNGKFYASNFFGYGRTAGATGPQGLTPGSIGIKFYNGAWQDWGMSNQTSSTDTKLATNTAYAFNLALDGTTHVDIAFTTDASDTTWGDKSTNSTGGLRKIQDALDAEITSNVLAKCTIEIVDGDIRITSYGNHTGTAVALAAPGSGTTPFGVGIIPIIGNIHEGQPGYWDDDEDTQFIMFDDGHGKLSRQAGGTGTINYRTGAIELENCPPQANMRVACKYEAALSGYEHGSQNNQLVTIKATSTNTYRDAYLQIVSVDDYIDDSTSEILGDPVSGGGFATSARKTGTKQKAISMSLSKRPKGGTTPGGSSY